MVLGIAAVLGAANVPISSVQVSLRGKKYDVEDVTTVSELQERVTELSGIKASDQGRLLFNGKSLKGDDSLSAAGVSPGDQLNMVPGKTKSKKSSSSAASSSSKATDSSSTASATVAAASDPSAKMKEMLKESGVDTDKLEEMYKNMGGGMPGMGGGANGEAPSMQESMAAMTDMMKSPIFTEYMNDPQKLEESRQMILNNPMMKSMMAGMPGMEEVLNDPDAWREAMQAAASMYQNMDSNDLMQAMMGGPGGAGAGGGMPPGLFDGMDTAQNNLALDELSEGED